MTIKTRTSTKADSPSSETPKRKTLTRARKPDSEKVIQAQNAEIQDALVTPSKPSAPSVAEPSHGVVLEGLDRPVTGRGVFAVRTLGTAVSVESAFLEENGNVLRLPAVFPNRAYALEQLEELRKLINQHFDDIDNTVKKVAQ